MLDFAMLARRVRSRGRVVSLRGARPYVRMLIEQAGLQRLPGVRVEDPTPSIAD
jgi:hypothetical protein